MEENEKTQIPYTRQSRDGEGANSEAFFIEGKARLTPAQLGLLRAQVFLRSVYEMDEAVRLEFEELAHVLEGAKYVEVGK